MYIRLVVKPVGHWMPLAFVEVLVVVAVVGTVHFEVDILCYPEAYLGEGSRPRRPDDLSNGSRLATG